MGCSINILKNKREMAWLYVETVERSEIELYCRVDGSFVIVVGNIDNGEVAK